MPIRKYCSRRTAYKLHVHHIDNFLIGEDTTVFVSVRNIVFAEFRGSVYE